MTRSKHEGILPNFVLAGAPKTGTTSLYGYLKQHPEIYVPTRKELHYFSYKHIKNNSDGPGDKDVLRGLCSSIDEYMSYFRAVKDEKAIGDISPSYLYFSDVSEDIKATLDHAKIIISLRNPIDRAFSNYMHMVRDGRESLGFYEALVSSEDRKSRHWSDFWLYAEGSLYASKVEKYISVFGKDSIHLIVFDDLLQNREKTLRDLYSFLRVADSFHAAADVNTNVSGIPKSTSLAQLLAYDNILKKIVRPFVPDKMAAAIRKNISAWNIKAKMQIDDRSRQYLAAYFRDDVGRLMDITGLDLSHWLKDMDQHGN